MGNILTGLSEQFKKVKSTKNIDKIFHGLIDCKEAKCTESQSLNTIRRSGNEDNTKEYLRLQLHFKNTYKANRLQYNKARVNQLESSTKAS